MNATGAAVIDVTRISFDTYICVCVCGCTYLYVKQNIKRGKKKPSEAENGESVHYMPCGIVQDE